MKQDEDYSAHLWLNSTQQWQAWISYNKSASRIRTKLSFASNTKIKTFFWFFSNRSSKLSWNEDPLGDKSALANLGDGEGRDQESRFLFQEPGPNSMPSIWRTRFYSKKRNWKPHQKSLDEHETNSLSARDSLTLHYLQTHLPLTVSSRNPQSIYHKQQKAILFLRQHKILSKDEKRN